MREFSIWGILQYCLLKVMILLLEKITHITPWSQTSTRPPLYIFPCDNCSPNTHTVSYCVIQSSSSPAPVLSRLPLSDIMGEPKVTHIYPIIRSFEKTHIELQLMLQWGPESERCYRPKRLGFQRPAKQKAVQSSEREGGELMGWRSIGAHSVAVVFRGEQSVYFTSNFFFS